MKKETRLIKKEELENIKQRFDRRRLRQSDIFYIGNDIYVIENELKNGYVRIKKIGEINKEDK